MKTTEKKYINQKRSELFTGLGCFFAFSKKQFKEGYEKANIEKPAKYIHVAHGLYCPKQNVKALVSGVDQIKEDWKRDRERAEKTQLKFIGIDNWNRPTWKVPDEKAYYGSINELFSYEATETEVRRKVNIYDLCYFGNHFGCEPMGTDVPDKYFI